jgi:hypothetical protein
MTPNAESSRLSVGGLLSSCFVIVQHLHCSTSHIKLRTLFKPFYFPRTVQYVFECPFYMKAQTVSALISGVASYGYMEQQIISNINCSEVISWSTFSRHLVTCQIIKEVKHDSCTKYMLVSRDQNTDQIREIKIGNRIFEALNFVDKWRSLSQYSSLVD